MSATPAQAARLFFAFWPSAADAARMMPWVQQAHRLCGGRPMRQDTLHLTLAFLGPTPVDKVTVLRSAAASWTAAVRPLTLEGFGCFKGPRVVWAGPTRSADAQPAWLFDLHDSVWRKLQALGWHRPAEPFRPHVSLLRKAQLCDVSALRPPAPLTWMPERCVLVASRPSEHGSRYTELARLVLQPML